MIDINAIQKFNFIFCHIDLEFKMMKYSSIIKQIVCHKFQNTEMKRQNKI